MEHAHHSEHKITVTVHHTVDAYLLATQMDLKKEN